MIRYTLLIFCFLMLQDSSNSFIWNASKKLEWNDFKGKPDAMVEPVAITASGISLKYAIKQRNGKNISLKTEIYAHFYPHQSWYKPKEVNAHILAHEQFHFNITEWYTRKFRAQVAQLPISKTLKTDLENLYKTINQELSKKQKQYDYETNYSRNTEQQKIWEARITKELEQFSKHAAPKK